MNTIDSQKSFERTQALDDLLKEKHGQKVSVAELINLTMIGLNPTVFGLPGGAILPIDQYADTYSKYLNYYLVKNEAQAGYAAGAYGLISGKPAFCTLTSGPGIMQGMVGLYNALMEFEPVFFISGNVFSNPLGNPKNRAFQKADAVSTGKPNAKSSVLAKNPNKIQNLMLELYELTQKHPHGPVIMDVPKDVQNMSTVFNYFEPLSVKDSEVIDYSKLDALSNELKNSKRPFVVLGRGALPARQEAWELIERLALPFGWTLKGKGILPDNHPQNYGLIGQHGAIATNQIMEESDLVIMIGTNGDDRAFLTNNFSRGKKALINPYLTNAQARLSIDIPIASDSKKSIEYLLKNLSGKHQHNNLKEWHAKIKERYLAEVEFSPNLTGINPAKFISSLSEVIDPDVLVLDVGEHQMHGARRFNLNSDYFKNSSAELFGNTPLEVRSSYNKRVITSGTAGTMATAIPYAAGVQIANPDLKVLTLIGDGGFEMQSSALWLISKNRLKSDVVVINNGVYGQVLEWMNAYHDRKVSHTPTQTQLPAGDSFNLVPNLQYVGLTYGFNYVQAVLPDTVLSQINSYAKLNYPKMLEAIVSPMGAYPMIPNGGTSKDAILPK